MSQTTVERGTDKATEAQSEDSQPKRSPFERMGLTGTALSVANWLSVIAAIYVLITAVNVIGSGFKIATGDQAEDLFSFASNPLVGLMIGVVATALTQSSSTTTSVTVGMVAGGMPLNVAVPIIMGANLGTTLTNTLVSLGMVRDKEQFRRGFAAATVHDFFNLLAVIIFLPLEMIFGLLESVATAVADATVGSDVTVINAIFEGIGAVVSGATEPLANGIEFVLSFLPETWQGIVMILVAIGLILLVINFIGKMLNILMVGQAKKVLHTAIGRGPVTGIASGTVITVMVQSSSTTTSLMVPLAGSGVFTLKQIYPFTLGANIGTTITALVSAFAFEGVEATAALTAAMVHLSFNVFATLVIYGLPFLRNIPPTGATWLANVAAERKIYAVIWAVGVFLVLPLILIFATTVF
ncbi:Na/Pi cotransporter family protein [Auritidibacter ignavus]|uniref:Na/Pi cotransporter family protein n=1 Tax=Auritidibacter ignavus TaxID=678932 RepID=UPI00244AF594|nr:Na/Pi cotransporter family protein [Auritidibacter ignavus]WGH90296.1 Na/Pi cotransporter family protein [Auritidibacter ignavus]